MKALILIFALTTSIMVVESNGAADLPSLKASIKSTTTAYRPSMVVYKNANCGCCKLWVKHLETNRFSVRIENMDNLAPIKERLGVPIGARSCHTGIIEGYFIEGHVPAEDIKRLLKLRPDAKGLVVPGMPSGSPGMELGDQSHPYDVLLVDRAGKASVFISS